jgi:hypothetical protein
MEDGLIASDRPGEPAVKIAAAIATEQRSADFSCQRRRALNPPPPRSLSSSGMTDPSTDPIAVRVLPVDGFDGQLIEISTTTRK